MSLRVRAAGAADAAAVRPPLVQLGSPEEPEVAVAERLAVLAASDGDAVLVAEGEGGAVLGVIALNWGAMLHDARPAARVGTPVVAEGARGQGVGARLVSEAEAIARARGCGRWR